MNPETKCSHESKYVTADILEGHAVGELQVNWCQQCGAYRLEYGDSFSSTEETTYSDWREPIQTQ